MRQRLIGLGPIDKKILGSLEKGPLHPSEISRRIVIPRTTVTYRLEILRRFGLAQRKPDGRKIIWTKKYIPQKSSASYDIYEGSGLEHAYSRLLSLPRHTTLLCIQGSGAIPGELKALSHQFIKQAHAAFKRKNIVMKGISNIKGLDLFRNMDRSLLASHIGRPLGIKAFKDAAFTASGEIFSSRSLSLFVNPTKRSAIAITDKGIAAIVFETLSIVFSALDAQETFDLNAYLRRLAAFSSSPTSRS